MCVCVRAHMRVHTHMCITHAHVCIKSGGKELQECNQQSEHVMFMQQAPLTRRASSLAPITYS